MGKFSVHFILGLILVSTQSTFAQDIEKANDTGVEPLDGGVGYWELPDTCNRGFKKFTCLKFQGEIKLINIPYTNETGTYNTSVEIPPSANVSGSCCAGKGIEQVLALTWVDIALNRTVRAEFNFTTEILSIDPLTYKIEWTKVLAAVGWNRLTPFTEQELLEDESPEQNTTSIIYLEHIIDYAFTWNGTGYSYECNSTNQIQDHVEMSNFQFQLGHSSALGFAPAIMCDLDNGTVHSNIKPGTNDENQGEDESYVNIIIGMVATVAIVVLIIYIVSKYRDRQGYQGL